MNGGCTKGFKSRDELARYIYGEYNNYWQRHVRTTTENGEMKTVVSVTRQIHAPDLDGRVHFVGQVKGAMRRYCLRVILWQ